MSKCKKCQVEQPGKSDFNEKLEHFDFVFVVYTLLDHSSRPNRPF